MDRNLEVGTQKKLDLTPGIDIWIGTKKLELRSYNEVWNSHVRTFANSSCNACEDSLLQPAIDGWDLWNPRLPSAQQLPWAA